MVFSHHTSETMTNPLVGTGVRRRAPGPRRRGARRAARARPGDRLGQRPHPQEPGLGPPAALAAAASGRSTPPRTSTGPQQSRIIEVADNRDGTLSHLHHDRRPRRPGVDGSTPTIQAPGRPGPRAGRQRLARPRRRLPRHAAARNVELLLPAPAFLLRLGTRSRPAGRRRRRSRGRGCRGPWSGCPCASSRRTNSRSSAGSDAVHFEPGVGLSGIRFTCTQPQCRRSRRGRRRAGRRASPGR